MEINGKIYRNLEGQVAYLTDQCGNLQNQIDALEAKTVHYILVEELPTEDIDTYAIYLVGPKGTEPDTYYEEWVYVQKADESWTWEKLGDTASVDLSGYLQKVTGTTSYIQAYCKLQNGSQGMASMSPLVTGAGYIIMRDTDGQINVPQTPSSSEHATSKKYVDDNFVAKQTGVTSEAQAYMKSANGQVQYMQDVAQNAVANSIPRRGSNGQILINLTPSTNSEATSKYYVDTNFLAKQTDVTTFNQLYRKNADGTQAMIDFTAGVSANAAVQRQTNGQISVPSAPVNTWDAVSKGYVDDVVGQLLYLHDIDLAITIDSTNKLYVKGYLINGSSTAITSFDRIVYKRLDVQWGAFGPSSDNAVPAAVTKMPNSFRQEDFEEPLVGFLYQYFSGGNLVSVKTPTSPTITITDVVTTW